MCSGHDPGRHQATADDVRTAGEQLHLGTPARLTGNYDTASFPRIDEVREAVRKTPTFKVGKELRDKVNGVTNPSP